VGDVVTWLWVGIVVLAVLAVASAVVAAYRWGRK
jgi:hypothetical protein